MVDVDRGDLMKDVVATLISSGVPAFLGTRDGNGRNMGGVRWTETIRTPDCDSAAELAFVVLRRPRFRENVAFRGNLLLRRL